MAISFISNAPLAGLMVRLDRASKSYIETLMMTGKSRDLDVTIALAMVMSSLVDLPSKGDDVEEFWKSQAAAPASDFVNAINNLMPVDYRQALELARKLFVQRYEAATMPFKGFSVSRREGVAAVYGMTKHIPDNVLCAFNECSRNICQHYDALSSVCEALCDKE